VTAADEMSGAAEAPQAVRKGAEMSVLVMACFGGLALAGLAIAVVLLFGRKRPDDE
jgi:hypothetical protein